MCKQSLKFDNSQVGQYESRLASAVYNVADAAYLRGLTSHECIFGHQAYGIVPMGDLAQDAVNQAFE